MIAARPSRMTTRLLFGLMVSPPWSLYPAVLEVNSLSDKTQGCSPKSFEQLYRSCLIQRQGMERITLQNSCEMKRSICPPAVAHTGTDNADRGPEICPALFIARLSFEL